MAPQIGRWEQDWDARRSPPSPGWAVTELTFSLGETQIALESEMSLRGREMAPSVKCLPCKLEDMVQSPEPVRWKVRHSDAAL